MYFGMISDYNLLITVDKTLSVCYNKNMEAPVTDASLNDIRK